MLKQINSVFLADDDEDDSFLFSEALREVAIPIKLTLFRNGEELMNWLSKLPSQLPDILFLDLNMPRKNGYECLTEIKQHNNLRKLKVVVFSTSSQNEVMDKIYKDGADYYMCKPNTFAELKKLIQLAVNTIQQSMDSGMVMLPVKENFVLL